jgi:hypothetical protein
MQVAFNPQITFATPGDLAVTYNNVTAHYVDDTVNNIMHVCLYLAFTPVFTNASGQVRITNLPKPAATGNFTLPISLAQSFEFPANMSMLAASIDSGNDYATIVASGSIYAAANVTANELKSGGNYFLVFSGSYAY